MHLHIVGILVTCDLFGPRHDDFSELHHNECNNNRNMEIKFLHLNGDAGISKIYVNVDLKAGSMKLWMKTFGSTLKNKNRPISQKL